MLQPEQAAVPCQNSVPAGRWGDRHESHGAQCPSYSLCWVLFARRSEPAPTSHSRPWRSGSTRPAPPPIEATEIRATRSRLLDVALAVVDTVERSAPCGKTADRNCLAPATLPRSLDLA